MATQLTLRAHTGMFIFCQCFASVKTQTKRRKKFRSLGLKYEVVNCVVLEILALANISRNG